VIYWLKLAGIEFSLEPNLVRGLDYYDETVFEVHIGPPYNATKQALGAEGAITDCLQRWKGETFLLLGQL
jgi:hypothetical protein